MNRRTIAQIINHYVIINTVTNEWIYEASTYGDCVRMVPGCVPAGAEYAIVAVMKKGAYKPKTEKTND